MGKRKTFSKVISWLMIWAMVLTLMPADFSTVAYAAEEDSAVRAEEVTADAVEVIPEEKTDELPAETAGSTKIVVNFQPDSSLSWSKVHSKFGGGGNWTALDGYAEAAEKDGLGISVSSNSAQAGWYQYEINLTDTDAETYKDSGINGLFNNGSWNNDSVKTNQAGNFSISYTKGQTTTVFYKAVKENNAAVLKEYDGFNGNEIVAKDKKVKLYFVNTPKWETPCINVWAAGATVEAGAATEIKGWGATNKKPALLKDDDTGYYYATITLSGKHTGLQFVDAVTASQKQLTDAQIAELNKCEEQDDGSVKELYYANGELYTDPADIPAIPDISANAIEVKANDKIALKIGDEDPVDMPLYNGFFETSVALEAGTYDNIVVMQNGEETEAKTALVLTKKTTVVFRLADGLLLNSVTNGEDADAHLYASATWVGTLGKIVLKDDTTLKDWDPADANAHLNYMGGGIWARTFEFKEALAENTKVKYKVAMNDNWNDACYGASNLGVEEDESDNNVGLTIPAGTQELTIWVDTNNSKMLDSVTSGSFEVTQKDKPAYKLDKTTGIVSLIGTIRDAGDDNWTEAVDGWEFTKISQNLYLYQMDISDSVAYKTVFDKSKWYEKTDGNKNVTVNGDTHIVILYDAESEEILDTVNDYNIVAEMLGMKAVAAADDVVDNVNGTTKFVKATEDEDASIKLVYGKKADVEKDGASALTTVGLNKGTDSKGRFNNSFVSDDLFLGDEALDYVYYYLVEDEKTLVDVSDKVTVKGEEYCSYTRDEFEGRVVTLPGTLVDNGGTQTWNPSINQMTYLGKGLYEFTFHNVAPANYEYKVAIDKKWDPENYGLNGEVGGANIPVTVTKEQDITVWYSDFSHLTQTSLTYTLGASISLYISEDTEPMEMSDDRLMGIYSATVDMKAGTYSETKIVYNEEDYEFDEYTVAKDKKVNFYFDPSTGLYYCDAEEPADSTKIFYDSKDEAYKSPFGAVATGEEITYSIDTGVDATSVKMFVKGKENKVVDLEKTGEAVKGVQKWSGTTSFDTLGEYEYFFAIYKGSAVILYSDDDGYYGTGKAGQLSSLNAYDQIIYQSGYKTPDWVKNAVIYQIFPERFNNGDVTNDTITSDARGSQQYEYMKDWYMIPENPEQNDKDIPEDLNVYVGDGAWSNEIYGGDLKGITQRIDYLDSLGVTVIYLNPVFESISSHRYDTSDYMNIDPILGTLGDFEELVKVADEHGMKVILDGVFNHVSDDSVYFDRYYEYLEEGTDTIGAYPYWAYVYDYMSSKKVNQATAEAAAKSYFTSEFGIKNYEYVEWFDVFKDSTLKDDDGKVVSDSTGLRAGKPVYGYDGWWGYDSMPIIKSTNGSEYQTGTWAQRVIGKNETSTTSDGSVTQYWLSKGMAGWRLDVANEVSDETWQHFRKSVKALDADNVIIGEIWTDAVQYLMGDMYDSVMNYMFRGAAIAYGRGGSAEDAMNTLEKLRERYPKEALYAMMNLVDSHDTARVLSYLDGVDDDRNQKDLDHAFPTYEKTSDLAKQRQYLVAFMQYTYAGAPTVYYGDELGMVGADDPDDRRAMIWGKGNKELVEWYATLAKIRSEYSALRTGSVEPVVTDDDSADNVLAYVRSDADNQILVMMNNAEEDKMATVDLSGTSVSANELKDVVLGNTSSVSGNSVTVTIPANRGVILVADDNASKIVLTDDEKNDLKPGYDEEYIVTERAVKVTGITLAQKALKLEAGQSASLASGVTVTPASATNKGVKWYSSNKKVAKVDATGKVTAVAAGTADISVRTNDGQFAAVCTVTVPGKAVVTTPKPQPVGTILTVGKQKYKVTSADEKNPTVSFEVVADKKAKKATIPATIKVGSITYKVTSIANNAFKNCKNLTKVTIGANIETIGNSAFSGCVKLKSVTIPKNVKTIGSKAFYGDKLLKKITVKSTVLKKVGSKAFKGINAKATIKVPKKQLKAYQKVLKGKGQAKTVKIKK